MPNWCYNRVRIDADSDQVEKLKEIYEIFENHSDPFNQILPIPDFKNIPNDKGCLLYTSPSPRDRQKSRMPSSA